jgi:hypothetical protein
MIDFSQRLTITHNGLNVSDKLSSFDSLYETIDFTHPLIVSKDVPVKNIYVALNEALETPVQISVSYLVDGVFIPVNIIDGTLGLQRNGYILTEEALSNTFKIEASGIVKIEAINILFSDDEDLKREYFPISKEDFKLGALNYNLVNEATRDTIIQRFRQKGISFDLRSLSPFDIFDINEVRQASIYLSLSKILEQVSDNKEDTWYVKSVKYFKLYEGQMKNAMVLFFSSGEVVQKASNKFSEITR